jgi:NADH-ubiquinone oxidoreductase chain 1
MIYLSTFVSILEVILLSIPVVLAVAYVTVAERKTMASMQRRLGPNIVGYYGLLQAFADAFKLLFKEYVSPTQANLVLFFLGPIITLMFSLLGYGVIPYAPGLTIFDFNLGILYLLAVSSLSTYGILLAGWSANSKYAFLGSLRSTAQLISYELILSSAILLIVLLTSSLNLTVNIEYQKAVWFVMPLFPVFVIFFIGSVAETNRAPFDLAEAESELVSGFMTEHAAVIFVFFFLAEYASIVLMCILTSILFLGGYLLNIVPLLYILYFIDIVTVFIVNILDYFSSIVFGGSLGNFVNYLDYFDNEHFKYFVYSLNDNKVINNPLIEGIVCGIILGIKSSLMVFIFIWVRASFPRIRFDQLMSFCWTVLLPLVFAFIVLVPCILYSFEILPNNILL